MIDLSVCIIVGGQYGSEGKGKITSYLAHEYQMSIRTGGPNAGHTVEYRGKTYILRQVPSAFVNSKCLLGIGAGALLSIPIFLKEIRECKVERRLFVDTHVCVIKPKHIEAETELRKKIGSTGVGVGTAIADRVQQPVRFVVNVALALVS